MDNKYKKPTESFSEPVVVSNKNEQLVQDLQNQNDKFKKEIEKWQECAKHYAFKLKDAYKGHLMVQGASEQVAEAKSREVLSQYNSCFR